MVEAICENEMPGAVFVLPTAGGKSLAYIVPCLCDPVPSMTIATIPFIAVKDEAFVNAHLAGIHAVDYKPGFQATVPLLMLSAEYITTPEFETFETFIRGKASEGVLRRIIIDEMHVVLIDGKWPNGMDTVHWIIELNVRVTPDVRTTEQCLFWKLSPIKLLHVELYFHRIFTAWARCFWLLSLCFGVFARNGLVRLNRAAGGWTIALHILRTSSLLSILSLVFVMLPFIGSWDECPGSCLELVASIVSLKKIIYPLSPDENYRYCTFSRISNATKQQLIFSSKYWRKQRLFGSMIKISSIQR
jgi:hypothetical protein